MVKEEIEQDIIGYWCGGELSDDYSQTQRDIISEHQREWDEIPCNSEGASPEQDANMNDLVEMVVTLVSKCGKNEEVEILDEILEKAKNIRYKSIYNYKILHYYFEEDENSNIIFMQNFKTKQKWFYSWDEEGLISTIMEFPEKGICEDVHEEGEEIFYPSFQKLACERGYPDLF